MSHIIDYINTFFNGPNKLNEENNLDEDWEIIPDQNKPNKNIWSVLDAFTEKAIKQKKSTRHLNLLTNQ